MNVLKFINFFRVHKSIGIDLGTANTLIYDKQQKRIVLNEPSVVAMDIKKKKVIAVGKEAREMLGKTPDNIRAIKPLKDGVIADFDVTKIMLESFVKKVYGNSPFKPDIMICVPLEGTSVEKKALFDSVPNAKKVYIIEEGRAAVLGSGIDISIPEGNMVVDIGGGSTDIAILSLDEIVASKSIKIASNQIDNDIKKYMKEKYNLLIGDRTAEKIKKDLGVAMPNAEVLTMNVKGRDLVSGLPKLMEISSENVYEAIKKSLYEIVDNTKEVLEKCPPELASDILDNGIIMTGGGSLIRYFDELMSKETNIRVIIPDRPLESVVVGAGKAFDNKNVLKSLEVREK